MPVPQLLGNPDAGHVPPITVDFDPLDAVGTPAEAEEERLSDAGDGAALDALALHEGDQRELPKIRSVRDHGGPEHLEVGIDRIRAAVTEATGLDVAACLEVASLPVDRRHNSKIDRTHLADWATGVLEGGSVRNP